MRKNSRFSTELIISRSSSLGSFSTLLEVFDHAAFQSGRYFIWYLYRNLSLYRVFVRSATFCFRPSLEAAFASVFNRASVRCIIKPLHIKPVSIQPCTVCYLVM